MTGLCDPCIIPGELVDVGHGIRYCEVCRRAEAQMLGARGVQARRIGHDAVSREAIGSLDLSGVEVVAISYLHLAGSPAHLRFLVRRLRAKAPHARVVVALWPEDAEGSSDAQARAQIGADEYAVSLKETLAKIAAPAPARAVAA